MINQTSSSKTWDTNTYNLAAEDPFHGQHHLSLTKKQGTKKKIIYISDLKQRVSHRSSIIPIWSIKHNIPQFCNLLFFKDFHFDGGAPYIYEREAVILSRTQRRHKENEKSIRGNSIATLFRSCVSSMFVMKSGTYIRVGRFPTVNWLKFSVTSICSPNSFTNIQS